MKVRILTELMKDRRTPAMLAQHRAIEQERADLALEALWRERVAENVRRRLNAKAATKHEGT